MLAIMPVYLFDHEPATCPEGHYLGPGRVTIGWMPCGCEPALEAAAERGRSPGHHYWVCRTCEEQGAQVWVFDPPHDPGKTSAP
jgi:hypothetical protein